MVLYPLNAPAEHHAASGEHVTVPAWDVILRTQKQDATEWWLVAQPDHAALAGDLATCIRSPEFPQLDTEVVRAIAWHDEGWAAFDRAPSLNGRGRPLSFVDMALADFLRAWRDSIARAEQESPIGGILVSQHFCRLGRWRRQMMQDNPEDDAAVESFLEREGERQRLLYHRQDRGPEEISMLVEVLQFCDLLSLYLCCGAREAVEFPQRFEGRAIRIHREAELLRSDPPLFGRGASLAVRARRFPGTEPGCATPLPLLLA
ncbi:MAG TPA: DUF3891 family protein [Terriglobales bacterium]|jgi:hypothetical protein|nr:DUF3891 family protein [Terriglobales bacterium]